MKHLLIKRCTTKFPFLFTVCIGLSLVLCQCKKEVSDTIDPPPYNPEEKTEYDSTYTIDEPKPVTMSVVDEETGEEKEQQYLCTTKKHSMSENPEEFANIDPNAESLWPGLLVKGSSAFKGVPVEIPIGEKRKNITVSLAIVSGGEGAFSQEVKPVKSKIVEAMNTILKSYNGGSAARYYYTSELINSQEHLEAALRAKFSSPMNNLSAKANFAYDNNKTTLLITLVQSFFTFSIDALSEETVFTDEKLPSEIANYVKPETDGTPNPLAYISSVTYGRVYRLLYTSTDKSFNLSAAVDYAYKGAINKFDAAVAAAYQKKFTSVSVVVSQLGGNAKDGLATAFINDPKDFSKIRDFIVEGAVFNKDNVGAPISYTIRTIKENKLLSINNTLNYVTKEYTPIKPADPTELSNVKDIDGNEYPVMKIGNQIWMAKNLKTTKFRKGGPIKEIQNPVLFSKENKPAYYGYESRNYGLLYNWYTVNGDSVCPAGWHIPSDAEWDVLTDKLGGASVAGKEIKVKGTDDWKNPNTGTNSSGFNALPGGILNSKGVETGLGTYAFWWTSTAGKYPWSRYITNSSDIVVRQYYTRNNGLSVRCVKND